MNQPPNSGMNVPPGYGAPQQPQGYGHPQQSAVPHSNSYPPPPGRSGLTRQIFNPAMYKQPGSGSWAAASLILAILGWVTLGCLGIITWPLGVLFGLIGMVGNKRGKGLSFAGFALSAGGIAVMIAFFALGMHLQFQSEGMAEDAGKPVVAAIAEFKQDNKRVPHSLEELIAEGYLPRTWNQGFEGIDSNIEGFVKGRAWGDFLAYRPGENAEWVGMPGESDGVRLEGDWDNWAITFDDDELVEHQTYGLAFVGLDNMWGGTDDAAVNQAPDEPFDLTQLWGGDNKMREFGRKRRELQRMKVRLEDKANELLTQIGSFRKKLGESETELRNLIQNKGWGGLSADAQLARVKSDTAGAALLKLIGRQQKVVLMADKKLTNTQDKATTVGYQVRMLETEEDMAKLADNPEEMAELIALLEETEKVLDDGGDLGDLDKLDEDKAAEDWFKKNFN